MADYAHDYNQWGYSAPWNRFSPYMAGLLLGYFLHITKKPGSFKMPGPAAIALWVIAIALGFAVVLGLPVNEIFVQDKPYPSNLAAGFYNGPGRLAWALAVSWVIFACCRGYGGDWQTESLAK